MDNPGSYEVDLGRLPSYASDGGALKEASPSGSGESRTGGSPYSYSLQRRIPMPLYIPSDSVSPELAAEHDVVLDAFDKELLAATAKERSLQATQGCARISLLPHATSPATNQSSTVNTPFQSDVPRKLDPKHYSSPSSIFASSPTTSRLQNRQSHRLGYPKGAQNPFQRNMKSTSRVSNHALGTSETQEYGKNKAIALRHAPPIVQGIHLVPATNLPDRFRAIFPFPIFNAVQSKCFESAFRSDDNLVLSAPTGSGKTAVMELTICRLALNLSNDDFKIVYQAPTKSLCAERFRDWEAKFATLDLRCAELTGDTEVTHLQSVQRASIIITTPEKWDSVTRKWKDHSKLMRLVKLFLIDEVHILKESRGATLEAIVSRMKSVGSNVRFVALSATVPNSEDIASWLGKNFAEQHESAHREVFGEEFRPVRLQKFVYGYQVQQNDFVFDTVLSKKLPDIIAQHSNRKPVMIFCCTRRSAIATALMLTDLWKTTIASERLWSGTRSDIRVIDIELSKTVPSGVAFHHAGLDASDRTAVEAGFLNGNIRIICSTSTLAIGVNLPCYLVILKGTMGWSDSGAQEYSDLEVMQMLGRAGRPQFESSACAVILTRAEQVRRYEKMASGEELLESCLHLNLIDHLNAEIGLGTVHDKTSAKEWLAGTFLYVRLRKNPGYYRMREDVDLEGDDSLLDQICDKDVRLLEEARLITTDTRLKNTEFGDAMARYYVKFETMKIILSLPPKARISELLSVLAQAHEFHEVRFKSGEKSLYKELNKDNAIRFPIKVDLSMAAHKVSLLIQSELGGAIYPDPDVFKKHKSQFQLDKTMVFSHIHRLIRCITDCQVHIEDAVSARNALELGRSLAARVWDNSSSQLKQIEQIGDVGVRKFAAAGINSIEILQTTEAHRIEHIMGRNRPFGMKILAKAAEFPHLRVSAKRTGIEHIPDKGVNIKFSLEIGFLNQEIPTEFRRKPVYVCFLAETSDGHLIDFQRCAASKIEKRRDIPLSVQLNMPTASINCYVMCDEIAGTCRHAELNLADLPATFFPPNRNAANLGQTASTKMVDKSRTTKGTVRDIDEFDYLDDGELVAAAEMADIEVVWDIDNFVRNEAIKTKADSHKRSVSQISSELEDDDDIVYREPERLPNGRFTCQHDCTEKKRKCKHKCCREGVKHPAKPPKKKEIKPREQQSNTRGEAEPVKKKAKSLFETARTLHERNQMHSTKPGIQDTQRSDKLHKVMKKPNEPWTTLLSKNKESFHSKSASSTKHDLPDDLNDEWFDEFDEDDLPTTNELLATGHNMREAQLGKIGSGLAFDDIGNISGQKKQEEESGIRSHQMLVKRTNNEVQAKLPLGYLETIRSPSEADKDLEILTDCKVSEKLSKTTQACKSNEQLQQPKEVREPLQTALNASSLINQAADARENIVTGYEKRMTLAEERQREKWADFDDDFYNEWKDYIELI